ncbi:hypothetical protein BDV27DRAFT_149624 [Aspergillus caelatus]|uniref:Uncharacterized protein n=1 Tax=Aspergillus caelatus TaxID=61420 RepID=A0A5N6ZPM2_9EURO|nr:uncharacterized protein BDV27DRAFT_149624 [Aspergillus caelatus]KAE8359375.1 hypothetical protein BDV27DRAFT_149624 [Aspergillus caelatus]
MRRGRESNGKLWLRDFLPNQVPRASIMLFGYISKWRIVVKEVFNPCHVKAHAKADTNSRSCKRDLLFACEDDDDYKRVSSLIAELVASTNFRYDTIPERQTNCNRKSHSTPGASVFWVHASSIDRFKEGYCGILDACGFFSEADNRDSDRAMLWLLIIDNADEASLFTSEGNIKRGKMGTATQAHKHLSILDYLPDCSHSSINITTRDQVDELTKLLEHLPLAIVQAMSFIQENSLMVGEYIDLYNDSGETRMDLLCEPFETLGRETEVPNALATTLMVSINHIKQRDTNAIEVLSLLAFLDQYHIPKSLLQKKVKKALDLVKALGTLKGFSLITLSRDKDKFSFYRLVQLLIRKWLIIEDDFEEKAGRCNRAEQLDLLILEEKKQCFGREHPKTLEKAEALDMHIVETRKKLLGPRHNLTLINMANLASAETLRMEVLEERKSIFGKEHGSTIDAMASLGALYLLHGSAPTPWLEEAGKQESVPYDMLARKHRLATIYWNKGLVRESENLEGGLFKESIQKLGQHHPLTLKCKYSVAVILKRRGREAEAIQLLVETTNDEEQVLRPFNENAVASIGTLSEWCGADKAIGMLLEAQEARNKYSHVTEGWESILNLPQQRELS